MDIRVIGSSVENSPHQFSASYLVNDVLSVDAGTIGFADLERQRGVRSIVISHAHLDHIGSLPIFLDNIFEPGPECPIVYASQFTIDAMRQHLFNDIVWPDFLRLSTEESPFMRFVPLEEGRPVVIEGLTVTPIALDHVVPTLGFIVDDGKTAVAFVSDTGQTDAIWDAMQRNPRIKAVFLEAAFPNSMRWLADEAKHLTPTLFQKELAKLDREIPVVVIHIKPRYYDAVIGELNELNVADLAISQPNQTYQFS